MLSLNLCPDVEPITISSASKTFILAIRFMSLTLSELLALIKLSLIFIAPAPLPTVKRPLVVIAPLLIVPDKCRSLNRMPEKPRLIASST